jgi:tetratricopeptide (TPR) repeat protein
VPQPAATPQPSVAGATAIIRVSDFMKSEPQVELRDLQKNEMPRLVGLSGSIRGKEFYLMRTEVKVGRSDDNDIAIDHQSMSRQHARFVLEDGSWKVIDNKSANGVHINGEVYAVSAVKAGDTVELGHLKFRFCAPGEKFTLTSEKPDEAPRAGMRPTTAELIAGARAEAKPAAAPPAKSKLPLVLGAVVVVLAVAGVGGYLLLGKGKPPGEEGGEADLPADAAVKAGDREFKKKDFLKAVEYYDMAAAKGANVANHQKAQNEAHAQEVNLSLDQAIAAGDFDKARNLYEKCSTEATYYCQRAQEKGDQVKQGYAKAHLAKAQAAKTGNKTDVCQQEIQSVLALDPANAEAQTLQCGGQQVAEHTAAPKQQRELSQKERDTQAFQLIQEGNAKVSAKDFPGAIARYQKALELKPSKQYEGFAYRGLGTAAVYAGDTKAAVKWYKLYLPFADEATRPQVQGLIDKFGG